MAFRKKTRNIRRREPVVRKIARMLRSKIVSRAFRTGMYLIPATLLIIGGWYMYLELSNSAYLAIKEIKIAGNVRVSRAEVLELAGINVGDNLLKISVGDIKKGIRLNPWVSEVNVVRHLPDRLNIDLKERKPIAFINLDSLYFVDETGVVFKKTSIGDEMDLPVITGLKREDIVEGAKASELAIKAVNLLQSLAIKDVFTNEELSEINVDKTFGLTLFTMQQGTRIELGDGEFSEKIERLERIIHAINGFSGVEFIGLNNNKGVVVRPASKQSSESDVRGQEIRIRRIPPNSKLPTI